MKKLIIFLVITISLVGIGFFGYNYALSFASTKVLEQVQDEFLTEDVVSTLREDSTVRELINQIETDNLTGVNHANLPFTTKEEGLKAVIGKFSASELKDIAVMASTGISKEDQSYLYEQYKDRFSEEEWQALLIIGVSELNK